jgi:uncharacterized protein involved in exopolysaccharide biosynthesis
MVSRSPSVHPTAAAGAGRIRQTLSYAARSVRRHPFLATISFVAVFAATMAARVAIPVRYQVTATVLTQPTPLLDALSNPGVSRQDWESPTRTAREFVVRRENLVALCKKTRFVERHRASSPPLRRAVDRVLALVGRRPPTDAELLDVLVDTIERRLWVVPGTDGTVTFTFEWSRPDLAYDVVEAAVQAFLDARREQEVEAIDATVKVLQTHTERLRRDIATALPKAAARARQLQLSGTPLLASRVRAPRADDEEVRRLDGLLTERRRALAEIEGARQRQLQQLRAQLAHAQAEYAPDHPAFVALRSTLDTLSEPSRESEVLRTEVRGLTREIVQRGGVPSTGEGAPLVLGAPDAYREYVGEDPRVAHERGEIRVLFRQYEVLLDRLEAARVERDSASAAFPYRYNLVTPPQRPKRPIRGAPGAMALAALLGGLAFAVFACIARDVSCGRLVDVWQVERVFGIPVLAEIDE